MQLIRINGPRLDPTNASVLLDCCVCPLTFDAIMPVGLAQQRHTDSVLTRVRTASTRLSPITKAAIGDAAWCLVNSP